MVRLLLLGTVDLKDAQGRELASILRRPKLLALLSYLTVARPLGFHRRDALVALLWPELDQTHARNALNQAVHALRQAVGHDVLVSRGEEELGIAAERLSNDVRDFDAALEAGDAERALDLHRGGLLPGFHLSDVPEFERWLDDERERLRRRACDAAQSLAQRESAAGNLVGAARWAERLVELSPYDEPAARRLVELLELMGDRAGAVRAFGDFERRLVQDLELEPSPETRAFFAALRARRTAEPTPRAPAQTIVPPVQAGAVILVESASSLVAPSGRIRARRRQFVLVLVLVLLSGGLFLRTRLGARTAEAAREPKRLVVLPFTNLGPAENEYFTDGISEEITARLATVDRLRVIGATSALRYKGTRKTIQEIGRELGVDYVMEGSVRFEQTSGGHVQVRVTPQLVRTTDGTHLWAEVYDRSLDEIFGVQSDIAQRVMQALDVTLLEPQRRGVEAVPTHNLQAYDYYLRGKAYMHRGTEERNQAAALRMFARAGELDTTFALTYAMLSRQHARMYLFHYDRSPQRLEQAKRAVDRAFALQPDLPEAHHSLGTYYWLGFLDYDRALREFAIAEAGRPNDSEIFGARAVLRQRQGKLREALRDHEAAWQLDPASSVMASNYALTWMMLRDFPRAATLNDRAIALAPDRGELYFTKALLALRWEGSTAKARAALDDAKAVGVADEPYPLLGRTWVELFDRRYEAAIDVLSAGAPEVFQDQNRFVPRTALLAQIYGLMRRPDLERAYYDSARVFVLGKVRERPDDPRLRSALGIIYAGLGRKREAIEEGTRAVELLPVAKEAFRGYHFEWDLARIYTMVGEHDAALSRLEHLLAIPGWLTPAWLRIDPAWDPLRDNPRFRRLAARRE